MYQAFRGGKWMREYPLAESQGKEACRSMAQYPPFYECTRPKGHGRLHAGGGGEGSEGTLVYALWGDD